MGGGEEENPDNVGGETETHEYVFGYQYDNESKLLTITYDCECGETYNGAIQFFITDSAENTTVEVLNGNGSIDFTDKQDDYTVIVIEESGNVIGVLDVKNKVEEPNVPDEPEVPVEPDVPSEPDEPNEPSDTTEPENPVEPNEPTEPETPNEDKEEKGNSSLLPVLLVIFVVLGVGGAVTYILIKKNKNKNKNKKEKGDK